jgi:hypothetical protein
MYVQAVEAAKARNTEVFDAAIGLCKLEPISWAVETLLSKASNDKDALDFIVRRLHQKWDEPLTTRMVHYAACAGAIELLQFLHSMPRVYDDPRYPRDSMVWRAANYGHVDTVKWLLAHGYEWPPVGLRHSSMYLLAYGGDLEYLRNVVKCGMPYNAESIITGAELTGRTEVLEWAKTLSP